MTINVGSLDKGIRIVIGLGLFSLLYFLDKPMGYLGLIGIIPFGTALIGHCPLYKIFGLSSCPLQIKKK